MKKLFQAVDIEKYIPFFKRGIASLIICSMLMIDVAKAMEEEEPDPSHLLTIVQRTPSSTPQNASSEQNSSSSDGDSSPRSESLSSTLRTTGLEIIDSRQNSDDSGSSPEKPLFEGDKSLPVIPFPGLSLSSGQNIPSALPPSSFPSQQIDLQSNLGITPSSLQDRVPSPQVFSAPLEARSSSRNKLRSSEEDPLLDSDPSSFSSDSDESGSDHDEDIEKARSSDTQYESHKPPSSSGFQDAFGQFIGKFTSTQLFTTDHSIVPPPNRWQSTPSVIPLKDNEILEHGGNGLILGQQHLSIQSQDQEDEISVDVDLDGDVENQAPQSDCCCSGRPFWPERPKYTLGKVEVDEDETSPATLQKREETEALRIVTSAATYFLGSLPKQVPENHSFGSEEERSSSFSGGSSESDSSPRHSPTSRRNAVFPADSSESDGDGPTAHLLPHDDPHRTMNYASFKGQLRPSGSFAIPQHDHEFDPTVTASQLQFSSPQSTWLHLLNDLKKLPAKAKIQLKDFVHQVLNGKSTWPQRLGKYLIGPIIGGVFAYMMGPVYDGGIGYLNTKGEIFIEFEDSIASSIFIAYIMCSAVPDGIARNSHLWKKGIAYLAQEGKEIGRMCIAGGISFLTAFVPPVYLITSEEYAIQVLGLSGLNNSFARTMLVGCPFLYLDAFANDFYIAWAALPEIQKWFGNLCSCPSLRPQLPVLQDNPREKFDNNLQSLEHFLFGAPKSVIDEIYNNVAQVKEGAQVPYCDNYDEALATQQAFAVLSYLLSLGDDVVEKQSKPKSIYDISVDVFNYLCLITGTPARALALQFIGYTVFGLVFSDPIAQILGGIYMIFALLPQTGLEYKGTDNFFKRFIFEEDPHGHGAHPLYRGLTKLYCAFQGLIYTFPLAVLTLQAFQQWFGNGWWPLAVGIPFFIPEFAAQTYSFKGTFEQLVGTSITNIHNTKTRKCLGKEPTSDWKRDWLIRFAQESRDKLKHWHPDMIANLSKGIEVFQKAE